MRILIPTIGSRGDVQPFIALGQGLDRAGHTVTIASHPVMEGLVVSHGVAFTPIGPDIDLAQEVAQIRRNSRNPVAGLIRVMRFSFNILQRSHGDIVALCRGNDLVVVSAQSAAGKNEADLLEMPYLSVTLMPWAIPWDDPERSPWRRIAYRLFDGAVSLITTRPLNRIRREQGLPPVGEEGFGSPRLNLIPVSPAVYEPIPNWDKRHRVVGYWFVDDPAGWNPPPELVAFLANDDPPIAVSLGAMSFGDEGRTSTFSLFIDAFRLMGLRAVVQGWEDAAKAIELPATVHVAGSIPHSWLLARCAAIVHHGGFGTTAAGIRAGIPALVIPHIADQFFWAKIVHELGIGPKPLSHAKLSADALANSLTELLHDGTLAATASSVGRQVRVESGIDEAVRLIEEEFN